MRITIDSESNTLENVVSDVPIDSITKLVDVLILLSRGIKSESLEWSLEPDYWFWHFVRHEDLITLNLELNESEEIIICNSKVLLLQLYRSLRKLELSFKNKPKDNLWSWNFPHEKLDELEYILKSIN